MKGKTFLAGFILNLALLSFPFSAGWAQEFNIYDQDWMLTGRVRDGKIFDLDMKVEGYIKDGRIFDKTWMLKGYIEGERIFDPRRNLQGYIKKRNAGTSTDDKQVGEPPRK